MNQLEYKGYVGSAEVSIEDGVNYGKLLHIRDLVSYESETATGLKKAFEEAVDAYLEQCAAAGVEPDQPYKGSFNVRLSSRLHRESAVCAQNSGVTLNEYVSRALQSYNEVYSGFGARHSDIWSLRLANLHRHTLVLPISSKTDLSAPPAQVQRRKGGLDELFLVSTGKMQ